LSPELTSVALRSAAAAAAMLAGVEELIADGITFVGDVVRACVRARSLVRSLSLTSGVAPPPPGDRRSVDKGATQPDVK